MSGVYVNGASTKNGFSRQKFSNSQWQGAIVVRASSASTATALADTMNAIIAQSQAGNLRYSQNDRDGIYNGLGNGKTAADCSSAVSYAVRIATGASNFNTATGTGTSMANALESTGAFMNAFTYVNNATTPLCPGDILIYPNGGHTAIVTEGNARNGSNAQFYSLNDKSRGYTTDLSASGSSGGGGLSGGGGSSGSFGGSFGFQYNNIGGGHSKFGVSASGEFQPRTQAPVIEPEEEYLPEELIEMIELGEITKEELEEFYDMYFIYTGRGGYSPHSDIPLTNRTYAWNRFSEVFGMQESCPLTQGNPGSWMMDNDGFVRDMAPELGAIMCFSGGERGYACVVEMILGNEVLVTSQVEGEDWSLKTRQKRYGMWDFGEYMFTGFIHNPTSYMGAEDESALETFCRIAEEAVGQGQGWVTGQTGILSPNGWSGAFVTACAKKAGSSLNIVIPNVDSVSTIGRVGVVRGMGKWYKGPIYGGGYCPSAGDIAIFRYNTTGTENIYKGDKAAIVVEGEGGSFRGVMGDDNGHITNKSYSCGSDYIVGYFSPDWERIDGTTASKIESRNILGLYTNGVSINDGMARTVAYVNDGYKPSISPSKVRLAAVNYTGLLANMYSVFGQAGTSTATSAELVVDYWTNTVKSYYQTEAGDFQGVSGEIMGMTGALAAGITSVLPGTGYYGTTTTAANVSVTATAQTVYSFLKGKGLSDAAATGIIANLQAESGFKTGAIGDKGTSAGLAQWHAGRMTAMQEYVGADWATNVSGQLNYLWAELRGSYSSVLKKLQQVPNTAEGARQATSIWIHDYEVPAGYNDPNSSVYTTRHEYANGYWERIGK